MKCPFRKITTHIPGDTTKHFIIHDRVEEEFAECYGVNCPYYKALFGNKQFCLAVESEQTHFRVEQTYNKMIKALREGNDQLEEILKEKWDEM